MFELPKLSYMLALITGLRDSVASPGALTAAFLFSLFVLFLAGRGKKIGSSGLLFILGVVVGVCFLSLGLCDGLLSSVFIDIYWNTSYFIISCSFCILGVICLGDWWMQFKKGSPQKGKMKFLFLNSPYLFSSKIEKDSNPKNFLTKVLYPLGCIVLGIYVSILEAAWPPNGNVNRLYSEFMKSGKSLAGLSLFLLYGLGYVSLMLMILGLLFFVLRSEKFVGELRESISKLQIYSAAFFLGFGLILLYYFF